MRSGNFNRSLYDCTARDPKKFCRDRFTKCKSLYRKDLLGHFGCVNAVEFSNDGRWLVSGGDDRRVLLWDVNKVTRKGSSASSQMKTEHHSNIFCTAFDNDTTHIFSAGNDEDVIRHNIDRAEAVGHFTHEEAVYCVALPYDGSRFFASAGECGIVFVWDVRAPDDEEQLCLAVSNGSFHGVAFNPFETQLIVTANAYDGVVLYDLRRPEVPLIKYGVEGQRESAMSAKFNQVGSNILALMRRSGPVLYDIANKDVPMKFSHADYKNICTLKSPCFVGEADEYIASGSDDFNIYLWANPGSDLSGGVNEDPFMILKGHRSIVNQIRFSPVSQTIASSGVEKVIKLWSQFRMEGCCGYITEEENIAKREFYSHEQYMQLIVESGVPLSHDYGMRSVDEDPRMLAFFDSLIQRVNAGWFSDDSSDEESPSDEVLLQFFSQIGEENDEGTQNTPNVLDFIRLFRSNRRLLSEESELSEDANTRNALNRRILRRLFTNETSIARDEMERQARLENASDRQLGEPSQSHSADGDSSTVQETGMHIGDYKEDTNNSDTLSTVSSSRLSVLDDETLADSSVSSPKPESSEIEELLDDRKDFSYPDAADRKRCSCCNFIPEKTPSDSLFNQVNYCHTHLKMCSASTVSQHDGDQSLSDCDKQPTLGQLPGHQGEKAKCSFTCSNDTSRKRPTNVTKFNKPLDVDSQSNCSESNSGTRDYCNNCSYCCCCCREDSRCIGNEDFGAKDCKRKKVEGSIAVQNNSYRSSASNSVIDDNSQSSPMDPVTLSAGANVGSVTQNSSRNTVTRNGHASSSQATQMSTSSMEDAES